MCLAGRGYAGRVAAVCEDNADGEAAKRFVVRFGDAELFENGRHDERCSKAVDHFEGVNGAIQALAYKLFDARARGLERPGSEGAPDHGPKPRVVWWVGVAQDRNVTERSCFTPLGECAASRPSGRVEVG